jgi:hypothetical protein
VHQIILDDELRAKLQGLERQIELCDETGRTVGFVVPFAVYEDLVYQWAQSQCSVEELDRIAQEPGERTTAEVLERLKAL